MLIYSPFSYICDFERFAVFCLQNFFSAMSKIVGTLGPTSQSVEIISSLLKAGMSGKI